MKHSIYNPMPKLTALFITIAIFSFCSGDIQGQTVKLDNDGNYYAIKNERTDSIKVIETGKTFKDVSGTIYKVYQSAKGKLFIYRISKNSGKPYKHYINIHQ